MTYHSPALCSNLLQCVHVSFIFLKWNAFKFSEQIFLIFFIPIPLASPSPATHIQQTLEQFRFELQGSSHRCFFACFLFILIFINFFSFLRKALLFPSGSGFGERLWVWLKSCLQAGGRSSDRSPDSRAISEESLEGCRALDTPSCPWISAFWRGTYPNQPGDQPPCST